MKTFKYNLLLLVALLFASQAFAEKTTKKVYQSFDINSVKALNINNKFGNIYIDDVRSDSVVVDVDIWVEGLPRDKARALLNKIDVSIHQEGGTVYAETDITSDFKTRQTFSIDYHISIPADRDLTVEQRYGNVAMNNLTGKGQFEIKYGNLTAKKLNSPSLSFDLAYSKAQVDQTNDLNTTLRYSKLFLTSGKRLTVDSRYSVVKVDTCDYLKADSRYDDFELGELNTLDAESMYTNIEADKLNSTLKLDNGYGAIKIGDIPAGFDSIHVTNKYASVKLGIAPDASYYLHGEVQYCNLKHPDSNRLNRMKENTSYEVDGVIGDESAPKAKVDISSRYGSISLMP
jgi:hypothetical protein